MGVLSAMTGPLIEPVSSLFLKILSLKLTILLAMTLPRRVREIQAVSLFPPHTTILEDRVVMKIMLPFFLVVFDFLKNLNDYTVLNCDNPSGKEVMNV